MAIKIDTLKRAPVTVQEYIAFLESSHIIEQFRKSIYDREVMCLAASWLRSLAENKTHLLAIIADELASSTEFQARNFGQSQSFVIHRTADYTIRIMLWIPDGHQAKAIPFSYENAHDHAFDLMSTGFFGPGYRTSLFTFDYDDPVHRVDGLTRLAYHGDTHLREGEVIYYFANRDVHVQHLPESLSASLNLIVVKPDASVRQTVFDLDGPPDNGIAWGKPRYNSARKLRTQRSIFAALAAHGNARSRDALTRIARSHELEEVRALAWIALLNGLNPNPAWFGEIATEKSSYIKKVVAERVSIATENRA
ncbi:hypothetical protein [Pandoraea sp. NPDC090278]|uniref:hypothetical protein n=1 Tax=Pandoraea sp. NPDC090278 TaxID=3364391 RepID=UPI00383B94B8